MRFTHPPFWFWRLDRWKLLAALLLALLALLMSLRGCGAPQVQTPDIALPEVKLPAITLPAVAGLRVGQPVDLDGTAAPGAKVQIFDGDKLVGETEADADGKWRLSLPALAAGAHNVVAKAFDAAGKELGAGEPWRFELPEVALPEVTLPAITPPSLAGLRAGEPVDLDGTAAPGAKVQIFDGDTLVGETVADADGKWRFSLPALAAGAHNVVAKAFDAAGKELGAGEPWRFELPEVTLPEVKLPAITLPSVAGLRAGEPVDLDGTAAPGAKVQIFDGDTLVGETVADADGKWRLSLPALAAGAHNVVAKAFDAAGKELGAGEPWRFELPEVALPEVTLPAITPPSLAGLRAGEPVDLDGTAAPGAKVQIFDGDTLVGETVADADGKWRLSLPALAAGAHNVVAKTFDAGGKELGAGEPWQFELPEVALPEVTLPAITPPSLAGLRAGEPVDLDGTAAPGAKVQIFDGDTLVGETVADADGKWRFSLPALAAGAHNVVAKTFDAAGKELGAGEPWRFELPEVTLPEADSASYPQPYTVTLEPGATLSVSVRGYCLDYGKAFPGQALSAVDLAPDKVRAAIAYAIQKGYADSDPLQVQLAVWNLIDGKRIPGQTYDVADEIIRFAEGAAVPEPAGVRTLAAALGDQEVSATIADYKSTSPANYQYKGEGALLLQNLTNEAQTLVLPYGFRFQDTGSEDVQDMGIFPVLPQQ